MKQIKSALALLVLLLFTITAFGCQANNTGAPSYNGNSSQTNVTGEQEESSSTDILSNNDVGGYSSTNTANNTSSNRNNSQTGTVEEEEKTSSANNVENTPSNNDAGGQEEMSSLEAMMTKKTQGSSKKKAYSDYIKTYKETQLLSFDCIQNNMTVAEGATIESKYMREGKGALRWDLKKDYDSLTKMVDVRNCFEFSVKSKRTATLKLWLFINDTDLVSCDHDSATNIIPNQATFFIRALDKNGREHCWNHTITDNGWHELELSFNVHNGVSPDFDYQHITGFYMMFKGKEDAVIVLDDLRFVEYTTNYKPDSTDPDRRIITDGEYDALDGTIIQEWYGVYYDTKDKIQGKSSLCCEGDSSVNDFRIIVADTNIALNYQEDVLVFWMKIDKFSSCNSLFIELNHVQDQHEYEKHISLQQLKSYGLTEENTWCKIIIPVSDFSKNLKPDVYGTDENIIMKNFRFVISPAKDSTYKVNLDRAYFTTISALL